MTYTNRDLFPTPEDKAARRRRMAAQRFVPVHYHEHAIARHRGDPEALRQTGFDGLEDVLYREDREAAIAEGTYDAAMRRAGLGELVTTPKGDAA